MTSCADPLGGVWRVEGEDARYHALDTGRAVELHPMFDSSASRPGAGAAALSFARGPDGIAGAYAFWVTEPNGLRRERWPARLVRCANDRLVIAYRDGGAAWVQIALGRE